MSVFANINILDTIVDTTLVSQYTMVIEDCYAQNYTFQGNIQEQSTRKALSTVRVGFIIICFIHYNTFSLVFHLEIVIISYKIRRIIFNILQVRLYILTNVHVLKLLSFMSLCCKRKNKLILVYSNPFELAQGQFTLFIEFDGGDF